MDVETLRAKHVALAPMLTERSRRCWAAAEARALGHGGIAVVIRATGLSRSTIQRGMRELAATAWAVPPTRIRRAGGGRKALTAIDATLLQDLDALVEPTAPGDPESPLRWCCQSTRTLAFALQALGHRVSHTVVAELLRALGCSLQGNVKTTEGRQTSGSGCAVSLPCSDGRARAGAASAGDLRRYQEERTGRRVQECGADVASDRRSRAGPRP